jgi:hypothetical protein
MRFTLKMMRERSTWEVVDWDINKLKIIGVVKTLVSLVHQGKVPPMVFSLKTIG